MQRVSDTWNKLRHAMKQTGQIDKSAADWECNRKGEELFHLRYYRSRPMEKKILVVEEMCTIADALRASRGESGEGSSQRNPQ